VLVISVFELPTGSRFENENKKHKRNQRWSINSFDVLPIRFTSKAVDVGPVTRMGRDFSSMSFPALLRCSGVFAAGPSTSFLALTRQPFKSRHLPVLQRCPC
jgi:hypothetical protein